MQNYWAQRVLTYLGLYKPGPADPAVFLETEDDPPFNIATDEDVALEDVAG